LGIQASSEEVANSSEPHATETSGGWMDFIKTQVAQVGSTVVSAGSAVTSGIAGISTSCIIVYASSIIFFADVATSVADGTRDAALEAARLSADAKDVAAFKAGNLLSSCFLHIVLNFSF
jgi:hypothetical protein